MHAGFPSYGGSIVESAVRSDALVGRYTTKAQSSFDYLKLFAWIGVTLASWALVIGLGRLVLSLIP